MSFDIDANGILHVSAKDKGTGKEDKITIKANSGLSEAEIAHMMKDAEVNAADDRKKLEVVQARNHGEAMAHSVRKQLGEPGAAVDATDKTAIEALLGELDAALKGEDKAAIEKITAALTTASQKPGQTTEARTQAAAGAAGGSGAAASPKGAGAPADDDMVDAEVHEVR